MILPPDCGFLGPKRPWAQTSGSKRLGPNILGPKRLGPKHLGPNILGPNVPWAQTSLGPNVLGPNVWDQTSWDQTSWNRQDVSQTSSGHHNQLTQLVSIKTCPDGIGCCLLHIYSKKKLNFEHFDLINGQLIKSLVQLT